MERNSRIGIRCLVNQIELRLLIFLSIYREHTAVFLLSVCTESRTHRPESQLSNSAKSSKALAFTTTSLLLVRLQCTEPTFLGHSNVQFLKIEWTGQSFCRYSLDDQRWRRKSNARDNDLMQDDVTEVARPCDSNAQNVMKKNNRDRNAGSREQLANGEPATAYVQVPRFTTSNNLSWWWCDRPGTARCLLPPQKPTSCGTWRDSSSK